METKAQLHSNVLRSLSHLNMLPSFADHLLRHHLNEFFEVQMRFANELGLPVLQAINHLSEDQIKTAYLEFTREMLTLLSRGEAEELIHRSVARWKNNQVPLLDRYDVALEDISLVTLLRKKTFLHFMPGYCPGTEELLQLVQETDLFLSAYQTELLDTYINLLNRRIDEHVHFIETITNTSPGIIYVYDIVQNREVYANKSVTEFLGYTEEELKNLGSDFVQTLIHPEDVEVISANDNSFSEVRDGEIRSVKYRIRNKAGEYRWMRAYETPFRRDREGKIVEKIGIAIDVHEQKKTADELKKREEELSKTQAQYQEAEAITHIGSYSWNFKTSQISWSDELYRIYGLLPGTPISLESIQRFTIEKDRPLVEAALSESLSKKQSFDFYYTIQAADGTKKTLHARGNLQLNEEGEPVSAIGTAQDVTEKQHLLEQLKHSDELYRQAEALARMGNYNIDLTTNQVEWTDQLYRIYDLEPQSEAITLERFFTFVHPQDRDYVHAKVDAFFKSGSLDYSFRIVTEKGNVKRVRSIANMLRDENGKPLRVIGTEQDITEKEDLLQKLEKNEYIYNISEQMANMGNWIWDLMNNTLTWTDQLYRIYGLEPKSEKITIERFLSFVHPDDRELVEKGVEEIFSKPFLDYTFRIITADGKTKTLRSVAQVYTDENGVAVEVIGTERDVTEKQNLIDNLQESHQLYEQAQSLAHLGNWSWDIKKNKVTWSDEVYRIYGLQPGTEVDYETYSSLLHPDEREHVGATVSNAVQTGEPYEVFHRVVRRDGTVRHVHGRGELVRDEDGSPKRLVGTVQDITDRQILIEKLQESERLYKQAQSLSKMGNFAWTLSTNEVFWSEEVYRIYNIPFGTPLSFDTVFNLVVPEQQSQVQQAIERTISNKKGESVSYAIRTQDGSIKYINLETDVVLDSAGNVEKIIGTAQDITEKQLLIEQLKQSQQLYRQAQALAHIGNWIWHISTGEVEWSDELYRIYELVEERPQMTFDAIAGYMHPEDREEVIALMKHCVNTGEIYDKVHRIVLRNGKIKTIHRRAELIYDADGKPVRMIGTTQDVTQQYRIQQELKENQIFIRKIADATPSIIASYNINTGKYAFVSEGLKKLLGYEPATVLEEGISFFSGIIHPEDLPQIAEKNAKALEEANTAAHNNDIVVEFTYRMKHKNGGYRWFHTYGTIFDRNAAGKVEHVLNISLDVTEQIEATRRIEEQEHFIQQIADASPTILYLFDVERQRIIYVNREIFFVLGYIPEEIYEAEGTVTNMLYHPDDYPLLPERNESNKRFQQADSMVQYECRMKSKDGEWRWVLVREITFKTNSEGKITQILGAALDIHRRKEIEKALLQNSFMLEQSNASLEEFAYVASHDLKEPLRKISTFGERLVQSQHQRLDDSGKLYLQKVIDASHRMQTMINDLLSISMISGNRSFEPCSLQKILEETLQTLEYKIEQQNAIIEADPLPELKVIPAQFRQLFQNLLSNSLKFVKEGVQPLVRIRCSPLAPEEVGKYQLAASDEYVRIDFEDNGIGFEEEFATKIFAIFQRLHGRSEYEGSGIGLAICKKIVEHHGGVIFASGELGIGATFTIILPA